MSAPAHRGGGLADGSVKPRVANLEAGFVLDTTGIERTLPTDQTANELSGG